MILVRPTIRIATRSDGSRSGELVLVSPSHRRCTPVPTIARTMQDAIRHWQDVASQLERLSRRLDACGWSACEAFDRSHGDLSLSGEYRWDAVRVDSHLRKLVVVRHGANQHADEVLEAHLVDELVDEVHIPGEPQGEGSPTCFELVACVLADDIATRNTAKEKCEFGGLMLFGCAEGRGADSEMSTSSVFAVPMSNAAFDGFSDTSGVRVPQCDEIDEELVVAEILGYDLAGELTGAISNLASRPERPQAVLGVLRLMD